MQQFKKKLKNTPKDTSQVLCSVNSQLNKEETLSVESGLKNDKLFLNNPDGSQSESNRKQNLRVSVGLWRSNTRHSFQKEQLAIQPLPKGNGFLAKSI